MKTYLAAGIAGLLVVAAQAQRSGERPAPDRSPMPQPRAVSGWVDWSRPLAPGTVAQPVRVELEARTAPREEPLSDSEIDVVDAHWMALTMWGEGRNQGEEGMRAVGHVIHNRWLAKRHGAYVTDTVSAAWQFSAWNAGDPNRAKMLNIEDLPYGGRDHRLWQEAKRISAEILSGRSEDPTGGALFYHTTGVQPNWSAGVAPVTQIGSHLFFRTVR